MKNGLIIFAITLIGNLTLQAQPNWSDNYFHILRHNSFTPSSYLFGGAVNMLNQSTEPGIALSQNIGSNGYQTGSETAFGGLGFVYINSTDHSNLRIGTHSSHKVIFRSGNVDRMTVDTGGNIGIGTVSPQAKLHIFNSSGSGTHYLRLEGHGVDATVGLQFKSPATNMELTTYQNKMSLMGGNMGIGVLNPDSKLVVDGTVKSEEVVVQIVNGPDYVFEEDYKLRTLKETKDYISQNKHLPEIPSAKEMEANGVGLADMNMRLLRKIEELTLYQIELMERLEKAEKEIQELKK